MSETRKCVSCGQIKSIDCFPQFKYGRAFLCSNCYRSRDEQMKDWRDGLDPSEQILFDQLKKENRLKIIFGARCILCNENRWIPDILPSNADKDDLPIDENWLSEEGKRRLKKMKWSKTPPAP